MIYAALYVMLLMWANLLFGQVGGGFALETSTFFVYQQLDAISQGPKSPIYVHE
jgi:hypothetical protein